MLSYSTALILHPIQDTEKGGGQMASLIAFPLIYYNIAGFFRVFNHLMVGWCNPS